MPLVNLKPGKYHYGSIVVEIKTTKDGESSVQWLENGRMQSAVVRKATPTADGFGAMLYLIGSKEKLVKPSPIVPAEKMELRLGSDYDSDGLYETEILIKRGRYYLERYGECHPVIAAWYAGNPAKAMLRINRIGDEVDVEVEPSPIIQAGEV